MRHQIKECQVMSSCIIHWQARKADCMPRFPSPCSSGRGFLQTALLGCWGFWGGTVANDFAGKTARRLLLAGERVVNGCLSVRLDCGCLQVIYQCESGDLCDCSLGIVGE